MYHCSGPSRFELIFQRSVKNMPMGSGSSSCYQRVATLEKGGEKGGRVVVGWSGTGDNACTAFWAERICIPRLSWYFHVVNK